MNTMSTVLLPLIVGIASGMAVGQPHNAPTDSTSAATNELLSGQVVAEGLNHPRGVAVQPVSGDLFIAESGAGRIVRIRNGQQEVAIVGFARDDAEEGSERPIGPLSVCFSQTREWLFVGGGGRAAGEDRAYSVRVPEADQPPANIADAFAFSAPSSSGADNFGSIGASNGQIFVIAQRPIGWMGTVPIKGSLLNEAESYGAMKPFFPTGRLSSPHVPRTLTMRTQGEILTAGFFRDNPQQTSIAFFRSHDAALLLELPTELDQIVAVGYSHHQQDSESNSSPDAQRLLYALNRSPNDSSSAGLYRLDAALAGGRQIVVATQIAQSTEPTAMAFGLQGELYIAELGEGSSSHSGRIIRLNLKE